jgi:hypothetical protein
MTEQKPLERITIDTGVKRVAIENTQGEVTGEISFNPEDARFREKFFSARKEIDEKMREFQADAEKLDAEAEKVLAEAKEYLEDENAETPPDITEARISHAEKENKLFSDYCDYMGALVDSLFGKNTAKNVTGGVKNPAIYMQFMEGVTPLLSVESQKNIEKYAPRRSKKRNRSRK